MWPLQAYKNGYKIFKKKCVICNRTKNMHYWNFGLKFIYVVRVCLCILLSECSYIFRFHVISYLQTRNVIVIIKNKNFENVIFFQCYKNHLPSIHSRIPSIHWSINLHRARRRASQIHSFVSFLPAAEWGSSVVRMRT